MTIQITPINKAAEEEGVWTSYLGVDLLIARGNNDNFKRAFRRLSRPYTKQIEKNNLSPDVAEDILFKCFAETILLNWKNFPNATVYSVDNAVQLFKNDQDCFEYVREFSDDLNNYLETEKETVMGE